MKIILYILLFFSFQLNAQLVNKTQIIKIENKQILWPVFLSNQLWTAYSITNAFEQDIEGNMYVHTDKYGHWVVNYTLSESILFLTKNEYLGVCIPVALSVSKELYDINRTGFGWLDLQVSCSAVLTAWIIYKVGH